MTVENTTKGDGFGLLSRWHGEVSLRSFTTELEDIFGKHFFTKIKCWVADFSNVASTSLRPDEIYKILETDRIGEKLNPHLIVVLIAPKNLYYGLSRMWEILAADLTWETFWLENAHIPENHPYQPDYTGFGTYGTAGNTFGTSKIVSPEGTACRVGQGDFQRFYCSQYRQAVWDTVKAIIYIQSL